ncbi:MAG: hypothetical protein RMJ59_06425 [Candidatus Nitrosocaldus sp.]|nr:hypothetical protein [Candidatus Nitrosocaldus sp.]MCS7141268.1 hypothetical protein [Candidatus Nitrosocaldus sp.]MDW8000233.1 hypothetical protein [Candidatus Nitrosocaldus sp.]MDW8275995.1 hypothetical protein [Candidatus Nitrosocaldus sp.]
MEANLNSVREQFSDLVLSLKMLFPHTDLRFVLDLMAHGLLNPDHKPKLSIEIFYRHGTDLKGKADALYKLTDYIPTVYASEGRLVVEPRLDLEDLYSISRDDDIESLAGSVTCCLDALLSRRKTL